MGLILNNGFGFMVIGLVLRQGVWFYGDGFGL